MPNVIRHYVDDPDEKLRDGAYGAGALIRTQSGAAVGGPFADLSGTGSDPTVPIVAGTHTYLADHPSGTSVTWYRARFENAGGTVVSDWSTPFQVSVGLCSLSDVKRALFPTGYTDTTDDGLLQSYIDGLTQEVHEFTRRQFVPLASADYLFDITANLPYRSLYVPKGVQSVSFLGFATVSQPESGGSYTTVTAANILLRPLPQDRRPGFPADTITISDLDLTTRFYPGFNTVKATMVCGFASVPADIERLAVAVVVRRYQARKGGQADSIGPSDFGGDMLRFTSGEERALLERYADVAVG